MQLECWTIQGASFHFGKHGLGQEQTMIAMPSDSLFAALVARLARTSGTQAVTDFCQPFVEGTPPFVLSSMAPFAGEVRFFPVPMISRGADTPEVSAKKLKRVRFVSEQVFRSLLNGTPLAKLYNEKLTIQKGEVLVGNEEFKKLPADLQDPAAKIWDLQQRPRVTLDRASSASNLFHIGQVHYAEGCGLWFGVRWLNDDGNRKREFVNLLHELALAGFGAERGVGMGVATLGRPVVLDLPDASGAWVTLSRYLPTQDETTALGHEFSSYSIKPVGGWLDSPTNMGQRRRTVNLIEEGSVIGMPAPKVVPGQIVDVRPHYKSGDDPLGHAVYRCGLALAVGLKGGAG